MNRSEKYMARIMFQLKVHTSDGQIYENLFSKVMIKHNLDFQMVKPYGNIGDRKNDGFDKVRGLYYQVFAPESIEKYRTISDAIKKLKVDFAGLKSHWDAICPIKEFFYVVNDKYKGVPATVHEELIKIAKLNPNIQFNVFNSNNLEVIFMELCEDDMIDIIGFIPNEEISFLDYDVLNDAVNFIMNSDSEISVDTYIDNPDFEKKLSFNNLTSACANLLNVASYQIGDLETFFESTGDYVRDQLKNRFKSLYSQSKEIINESEKNYADKRLIHILKKASPSDKKAVRDAVLVLMSYYFEACDIFEKPVEVNKI
jgi:hypothetical protein